MRIHLLFVVLLVSCAALFSKDLTPVMGYKLLQCPASQPSNITHLVVFVTHLKVGSNVQDIKNAQKRLNPINLCTTTLNSLPTNRFLLFAEDHLYELSYTGTYSLTLNDHLFDFSDYLPVVIALKTPQTLTVPSEILSENIFSFNPGNIVIKELELKLTAKDGKQLPFKV